jgi:ligand-binding sensor domain-containing protein
MNLWSDTSSAFQRVENLFEDSKGNIWFQRGQGVGVYLAAKDSILNFIFSNNPANSFNAINTLAEDKKGRLWISGGDGWLGYALTNDPTNCI